MLRMSRMEGLGAPAQPFALPDIKGKIVSLDDFAASPALLVAFICNHCPFVLHIIDELATFAKDYASKGLAKVGDMRAAVDALLNAEAPPSLQRASAGCSIKWRKDRQPSWA